MTEVEDTEADRRYSEMLECLREVVPQAFWFEFDEIVGVRIAEAARTAAGEAPVRPVKAGRRRNTAQIAIRLPGPLSERLREAADDRVIGTRLLIEKLLEIGLENLPPPSEFLFGPVHRSEVAPEPEQEIPFGPGRFAEIMRAAGLLRDRPWKVARYASSTYVDDLPPVFEPLSFVDLVSFRFECEHCEGRIIPTEFLWEHVDEGPYDHGAEAMNPDNLEDVDLDAELRVLTRVAYPSSPLLRRRIALVAEKESRRGKFADVKVIGPYVPITEAQAAELREDVVLSCPDSGACHHDCLPLGPCFRVLNAEPLSDVFPADEWPVVILNEHKRRSYLPDA